MRTYPALHQAATRCAGMRLRELADLVEDLALHDTSARLAHLLLRHLDDNENTDHRLHGLVHEDIARLIGSVRVVVNRLLNRFKHEGIIHTEAGNIRLADLERLQKKAERRLHRG
jgi:CRP-like cAMP-binding protein